MKTDSQSTTTTITAARIVILSTDKTPFRAPFQSHHNPLRRCCSPSETAQKCARAAYKCHASHLSVKIRACTSQKKNPL